MTSLIACFGVIAAFLLTRRIATATNSHPLANAILMAALLVGGVIWAIGLPLRTFEAATAPLRWALGPAIVALGQTIYERRAELRRDAGALLTAVAGGSAIGILSAVAPARMLKLDDAVVKALSTKSVTSPFAIALMERLGGPAALAAGLVIVTGIIGAILLPPILKALRLDHPATLGVAMGQAAHIVGTEALTRHHPRAAGFSSLAMVLAGLATAVLLPLFWLYLF